MPRYQIWGREPNKKGASRSKIQPQETILANSIEEAARKIRDRTGSRALIITSGMEDMSNGGGPLKISGPPKVTINKD